MTPPTARNAPTTDCVWPAPSPRAPMSRYECSCWATPSHAQWRNQRVPDGCYHLHHMIESAASAGAEVGCCGTCLDARGIGDDHLTKGSRRSTLNELADWSVWADKVVTF